MNKILTIIAAGLCCASSAAYAGNWYIGAGLGAARAHDTSENIAAGRTGLTQFGISDITSNDNDSTAASFLAGYRFNRYLGAEFAYADLGDYYMRGFTAPAPTLPTGLERDRVDAFSLDAVLSAPIGNSFGVYAKIGQALATVEQRNCVSDLIFCDYSSDTNDTAHVGAGVVFTPHTLIGEIRLAYDLYDSVHDRTDFTAGRFTVWQVQYIYNFGE